MRKTGERSDVAANIRMLLVLGTNTVLVQRRQYVYPSSTKRIHELFVTTTHLFAIVFSDCLGEVQEGVAKGKCCNPCFSFLNELFFFGDGGLSSVIECCSCRPSSPVCVSHPTDFPTMDSLWKTFVAGRNKATQWYLHSIYVYYFTPNQWSFLSHQNQPKKRMPIFD